MSDQTPAKRQPGSRWSATVRLLLALAAGAWTAPVAAGPASTVVRTSSGPVGGTILPSGIRRWLGIPYAAAPTGELRWRAPQPISWEGTYNADRWMPSCIQSLRPHNFDHYFGEEATSENCLYLNVWAPRTAAGKKLPVIVYIHGGGNVAGSSAWGTYGGEAMAGRGAVFVSFNYRLGLLGFLSHPELSREQGGHSGNYGYQDQQAALRWVRANAARFGGDPDRVLLMGQSAGAMGVTAQIFSPGSRGLFSRAAMLSGCRWDGPAVTLADAEAVGLRVQSALGVSNIAQLRDLPADRFLTLPMASLGWDPLALAIDGAFLPRVPQEALTQRAFADVPVIATLTHDESRGPLPSGPMTPLLSARTAEEYRAVAQAMYGRDAARFLELYPAGADAPAAAERAAREGGWWQSARACARSLGRSGQSAAFLGMFERRQPFLPGVRFGDKDVTSIGAYHTSDVPYWLGTLDSYNKVKPTRGWTEADRSMSERMSDLLVAFAATGAPTTSRDTWPAWTPGNEQYLDIDETIAARPVNIEGLDWLAAHRPAASPPESPR